MTGAIDEVTPKQLPVTARGRRSRQALLDAAKVVFARDGFAEARITDIADTAKVAHGSFYTYFSSKEEVFVALLRELEDELRSPGAAGTADEHGKQHEPYESILRANTVYLDAYHRNREIMIVWEQVATLNAEVEDLRRAASDRFAARIEAAVRHWQGTGVADPALDAACAAVALTGMVSNFVYRLSARRGKFDLESSARQLSLLWANALGVRVPEHRV
ncbi:hypothetical protein GCM10027445_26380 [Amycolatopsis endophytica]|uniref:AcrR family transcriptional regulator n=1 Tax=Amycolatopsis endophytica TaxID=860233 RepID=A0A853BC66_9PSEU|nr:TetR/AcrR family transcriptional regulator [Amycolatopsis endophytica]NYI92267.1 AcrR family transcriptional regulator [Amycolatopsis endophytica]